MPRRIVISVTNDLSSDQRVHRIADSLHGAGYDVLLVGRRKRDSLPLYGRPYRTHRMRLIFERGKLFYMEFAFRLFWFLLFRRASAFISNDLDTLLANWLVARLRGKKLFYDSHEFWTEVPELVSRPRTRAIWLWLEKRLFPRVDAAYTVNDSLAEIYREKYGLEMGVVRNLPKTRPVTEREEPGRTIIYQGALNPGRGIDRMIAAMAHLPAYRLRIIGKGEMMGKLYLQTRQMGLTGRVEFAGFMPFKALHRETVGAALGLSLEAPGSGNYRLALPNKLFDYIMAGVPVLVSDFREMAGIVNTYGVGETADPDLGPEELAGRIRAICEDTARWKKYHLACLSAAETLCWEKERDKLLRIVEGVLSPSKKVKQ